MQRVQKPRCELIRYLLLFSAVFPARVCVKPPTKQAKQICPSSGAQFRSGCSVSKRSSAGFPARKGALAACFTRNYGSHELQTTCAFCFCGLMSRGWLPLFLPEHAKLAKSRKMIQQSRWTCPSQITHITHICMYLLVHRTMVACVQYFDGGVI